ncbi:MAG: NAD(P)H-hydrate epimerase [Thermomicrobiales bacterium]|nr:NAD(P)H-hydrate epimerase [Thermomicrobiales bacterium]
MSLPLPSLTPDQMSRVDRIMTADLGVDVLQLMELAGQAVAAWARGHHLGGDTRGTRVLALAGSGGNGGDAMVAARLLHAWGAEVAVWLSHDPAALRGAAAHQARSLAALGLPVVPPAPEDAPVRLPATDLVLDGLLGFGLSGPPAGAAARLIAAANDQPAPILAIDLPSGLDARSGEPYNPCIRAASTLTLALPKTGLLAPDARSVVGQLAVADIGVPPEVYARLGIDVGPLFGAASVLRVEGSRSREVEE